MSPNTNRSPASVPVRLAPSFTSPVTNPRANCHAARCTGRASASTTAASVSSGSATPCASARSTKLRARSTSSSPSATATSAEISPAASPRAARRRSESRSGASCAVKTASAWRACGHTTMAAPLKSRQAATASPAWRRATSDKAVNIGRRGAASMDVATKEGLPAIFNGAIVSELVVRRRVA